MISQATIDERQHFYDEADEQDKGYFAKEIALADDLCTGRRALWIEVYLSREETKYISVSTLDHLHAVAQGRSAALIAVKAG